MPEDKQDKKKSKDEEFSVKKMLNDFWRFIWYDDSIWSWIANVVLAFVLIKFIFYPLLGVVLGTGFPIVAVVSTSMVHDQEFDDWWATNEDQYLQFNITKEQFAEFSFKNGFNKGDLMVIVGKDAEKINVGDIIVFQSGKPYPIIHRVVKKENKGLWVFETKGDNNKAQIRDAELDETRVLDKSIIGKAGFRIPWLGYVKIWFVDFLNFIGFRVAG